MPAPRLSANFAHLRLAERVGGEADFGDAECLVARPTSKGEARALDEPRGAPTA